MIQPIAAGIVSGLIATAVMTLWMMVLQEAIPTERHRRLPPGDVAMGVAQKTGIAGKMDEPAKKAAIGISHFGFGIAASLLYALLFGPFQYLNVWSGILFGSLIYLISYTGWIPLFRIMPFPTEMTGGRNFILISSHLLWGAVLGSAAQRLI